MSQFTAPLLVTPLDDGRTWLIVSNDFRYEIGVEGSGDIVSVPQWMATDFASVPRPVWWFAAPWGRHGHAAVIHDAGYFLQDRTRRAYDDLFLEAMLVLGTKAWRARLMYWAVRVLGGFAWRGNARRTATDPTWKIHPPVTLGLADDADRTPVEILLHHREIAPSAHDLAQVILD